MEAIVDSSNGDAGRPRPTRDDKRTFSRIIVDFPATVRVQGTDRVVDARVLDLSGSGLRLTVASEPAVGDQLSVLMQMGDDSIVTSAEVVWSKSNTGEVGYDVACRFVD